MALTLARRAFALWRRIATTFARAFTAEIEIVKALIVFHVCERSNGDTA